MESKTKSYRMCFLLERYGLRTDVPNRPPHQRASRRRTHRRSPEVNAARHLLVRRFRMNFEDPSQTETVGILMYIIISSNIQWVFSQTILYFNICQSPFWFFVWRKKNSMFDTESFIALSKTPGRCQRPKGVSKDESHVVETSTNQLYAVLQLYTMKW